MEVGRQVPRDFASFVAEHERRLRAACNELTGNDRLADLLRRDLTVAVALRWRWLRLRRARSRAGAASAYLDRLVRYEARAWRVESDRLARLTAGAERARTKTSAVPHSASRAVRPSFVDAVVQTPTATRLAQDAWERARRLRRRRRLVAVGVAALLVCIGIAGPRPPPAPRPSPLPPLPTTVPAGVRILPAFNRLADLDRRATRLPQSIDVDPASMAALSEQPVGRAVAVMRQDLGPLVVVAEDGRTRRVDDPRLAGARLLSTSLSPDGARAALAMSGGVLIVDISTGEVRPLLAESVQPAMPTLVWRNARTVLVPAQVGALELDVDTGAVAAVGGLTGLDVVTTQGVASGALAELVGASSTAGQSPRIRVWRTTPAVPSPPPPTVGPTVGRTVGRTVGPDPSATPGNLDVDDRPIAGPSWLGGWTGAGWSNGDILARVCSPRNLVLPAGAGTPRAAVGAISANGLYAGALVAVDTTQLEILGFADPVTFLVGAHSSQVASLVLAWNPRTGDIQRVAAVDAYVRVSVTDLLTPA